MQRIVVAQRSKEQGIVVNFVDTTMQRASLSTGGIEVGIFSFLMLLILRNVSTSFIFS